jgi:hypothetical protein
MKLIAQIAEGTLAIIVYTLAFILGVLVLAIGIVIGIVLLIFGILQIMRDKLSKVV